ncbi:hypothetical protein [Bradyrhizobium sp. DASA03007]|uniref:hypothetical protein n=1 Tax=unclassified Bradyrhizobium TaxID=2631580 RepID=UPI003F6EEA8D
MPKAARIFSAIPSPRRSAVPVKRSGTSELVAVALFSAIGPFVSLVAVILGMQGVWI